MSAWGAEFAGALLHGSQVSVQLPGLSLPGLSPTPSPLYHLGSIMVVSLLSHYHGGILFLVLWNLSCTFYLELNESIIFPWKTLHYQVSQSYHLITSSIFQL